MGLFDVVARFVDALDGSEARRELAREEAQRQVGNWQRLNRMADEHAKAGQTSTAFSLWRQAGVSEARADTAAREAGGKGWLR